MKESHSHHHAMDSKKSSKYLARKHKRARHASSSDSSSSDSDSGSSSDSSSSSSGEKKATRKKVKKSRTTRQSSSSSDDDARQRKREKHACHKKLEAKKLHLKRKLKEAKAKKRAASPSMRRRSPSPQKVRKLVVSVPNDKSKHHLAAIAAKERMREKEREREREREREKEREREREKEREKLRMRERERIRSRSPKQRVKSRSPKAIRCRDIKRKSPIEKHQHHLSTREKIPCQSRRERTPVDRKKEVQRRHDESREREQRRDRERAEREAARNKEREEALARCQERQRERERLAKEKLRREKEKEYKNDRLLPRPAEREMAIAAARAGSRERSFEADPRRAHSHRDLRADPSYDRAYEREREFLPHENRLERDDRREIDREREYMAMRRREAVSPQSMREYSDRMRASERDLYTDEQRYERERAYAARGYPPEEIHLRDRNWEREHDLPPRERDLERYPIDRPAAREWEEVADWHGQDPQWDETWPRGGEPPEENWDADDKYQGVPPEWDDHRANPDLPRDDHGKSRRWPQDWRGRISEERHGGNYRHGAGAQQMDYPHERYDANRRHHPHGGSGGGGGGERGGGGGGGHHSSGYHHPRPLFHPKRQIPFGNTNQNAAPIITPVGSTVTTSTANIPSLMATEVPNPLEEEKALAEAKQHEEVLPKTEEIAVPTQPVKDTPSEVPIPTSQVQTETEPAEEAIPDDLSEISDDADEILNKVDVSEPAAEKPKEIDSTEQVPTEAAPAQTTTSDQPPIDAPGAESKPAVDTPLEQESPVEAEEPSKTDQPTTVDEKQDLLDFEEISDGEWEEDSRVKNLGDALGVDWASLVEESQKRESQIEKQTTAKQKWQPHRIILDVGISVKAAGLEFATKMLEDCKQKLDLETAENKIKSEFPVKLEEENIEEDSKSKIKIKEEPLPAKIADLSPLACFQVAQAKKAEIRNNLIFNACRNSRALSARVDLKRRRQMCGLPIREVNCNYAQNDYLKKLALDTFLKTVQRDGTEKLMATVCK